VETLDKPADVPDSVVAAVERGDPAVFGEIVATYDLRLRSLTYRLIGADQSLQDVMQEIYMAVFRGLPGFRGESGVATWIYRVAYTTCLHYLKGQQRQVPVADCSEDLSESPDHAPQVVLRLDLATALAALPVELRAVVLLVDRDGFDYRSAAAVLGVPVGTIGSRLSSARARLRHCLVESTAHGEKGNGRPA